MNGHNLQICPQEHVNSCETHVAASGTQADCTALCGAEPTIDGVTTEMVLPVPLLG